MQRFFIQCRLCSRGESIENRTTSTGWPKRNAPPFPWFRLFPTFGDGFQWLKFINLRITKGRETSLNNGGGSVSFGPPRTCVWCYWCRRCRCSCSSCSCCCCYTGCFRSSVFSIPRYLSIVAARMDGLLFKSNKDSPDTKIGLLLLLQTI